MSLEPGASTKVTIELGPEAFEYYDGQDGLEVKAGRYQILYGSSSADGDLQAIDLEVKA